MTLENLLKHSLVWKKCSVPEITVSSNIVDALSPLSNSNLHYKFTGKQHGFSYIEVIVAMFILSIAIVPAMEAIQSGIQGAEIHETLTQQHFALIKRMEETQAEVYGDLLNAAQTAGNNTTPSSYSDSAGQIDRLIVFLALYDADADPFTLIDPDNDGDADSYTGDTSDLLWLQVTLENSTQSMETLISR